MRPGTPTNYQKFNIDILSTTAKIDFTLFKPFPNRDEINRELCGTGIIEAVNRDLKGITQEFTKTVVPFISKHADLYL